MFDAETRTFTIPGDLLDDSISTPRGWLLRSSASRESASKVRSRVLTRFRDGERAPTFNAPNARAFHKSMKLLAPTTDRIPEVKKGVSAVRRTVERIGRRPLPVECQRVGIPGATV